MVHEVVTSDPLSSLKHALEPALNEVDAWVEVLYTGSDRGSLSVHRQGKVMQTSFFSSLEIRTLRDGGNAAVEKQKEFILAQIHRLLNPPKPQPISLGNLALAKRGRPTAKKVEAEAEGEVAPEESSEKIES